MKPLLQFLTYILGCYSLAAILFAIILKIVLIIPIDVLIDIPIEKLIQKGGIIIAIFGIWPFLRALKLNNPASLGYNTTYTLLLKNLLWGLIIGIGMLLVLMTVIMWLQLRFITPGVAINCMPFIIIEGIVAGFIIAIIEEIFFRGALYTALRHRYSNANPAILGASFLYAILHFLRPQPVPEGIISEIDPILWSLLKAINALFDIQNLDALVGLFTAGVLLALFRERTGHIGLGVGVHTGWILVIKLSHKYTDVAYDAPWIGLISHYDGVIGWLAAIWIGIIILLSVIDYGSYKGYISNMNHTSYRASCLQLPVNS